MASKSATAFQRHRNGKEKLEQTYWDVFAGWNAVAQQLQAEGNYQFADEVRLFVTRMTPPATDQEQLAEKFRGRGPERLAPSRTR
jgi:hypothetical protein